MTLTKVSYAASFILLASTALASATVVTQTESFGPASTNWGTSTNDTTFTPTQTLNFAGFNTALGTLNSVVLTFTDSINGTVNLTNNGTNTTNVSGDLINTARALVPGISQGSHPGYNVNLVDDSTSYTNPALGAGLSTGPQTVSGSTSTSRTITGLSALSLYSTAWAATVGDLGQVAVTAGNANGSAVYTDLGQVTVTAAYSYTPVVTPPVPEPAGIAALGVGLAGLGVIRRRRKA